MRNRHYSGFIFLVLFTMQVSARQHAGRISYDKKEVMVPMRDGIRLFTRIYTPHNTGTRLPILLMRSPYSDWNMGTLSPEADPYVQNMAQEGYIFVYQNIRGKQRSEGRFVMEGAFDRYDRQAIDEASDTWDLIEWLLKNVRSNGKVGQLGISYPGELALISGVKPHPALKAVSPQATVADFFLGDDYYHNGAFRLAFSFEYAFSEEAARGDTTFPFKMYDLFDWYYDLGPLRNVNDLYFHNNIPTWNDFCLHPAYDSYWAGKSPLRYADTPLVPTLHVAGYWDEEDRTGPQDLYAKMERYDTRNYNYLVLGPWCHGQWAEPEAPVINMYEMGRNTAEDFRKIQKKWFDFWLKGKGDGKFPEAQCFQTGSNVWKQYDTWPDKIAQPTKIYLHGQRKLSFGKPANDEGYDRYTSDPENPVPYRPRPIELTNADSSDWDTWLTEDQRFAEYRPDVLSYKTAPLEQDLTVTGDVVAHLYASITGTDADWVVKLIDVYPDYYVKTPAISQFELIIAADILRGRFRKSFSAPQPVSPGKVEEYDFSLHQVNHVFKKGHRIMVQIQSSWFPIFDRNPQRYVPNIFLAAPEDFIRSEQRIYHDRRHATCIELPVEP